MKKYNCIFTGGSTRGLCYVGVLKALEEYNIQIENYIGSSIGALMMTFYALGYSVEELESEIDKLDLWKLFIDFNFGILFDCSFSNGEIYLKWLREKIETKFYGKNYKKGKMKPVCFKDIDKNLYVIATNFENSSAFIFSKETTPGVEIALALRASSSMPFLMKPYKLGEKILIDGDILRGRPIYELLSFLKNKENLLEFRITGGKNNKFSFNPIKLVNSIVNVAAYTIDNYAVEANKSEYNILQIDVENLDFTDFNLSLKRKKEIYKIGYEVTSSHLKNMPICKENMFML